jgi:LPS export ABC transporter protein LptC
MFQNRNWIRIFLLGLTALLIIAKIVALSPSSLEESKSSNTAVDPNTLLQDDEPTLVPGIPKNRIAEYTIDKFQYVSVQNGEKQWRIESDQAFLYNPEKLVHSRRVKAYLYDPDGKVTLVTGREAKYFMNKRDLELFGNVKTVFPDGFELDSEYLRYKPNDRHIEIPIQYAVAGAGHQESGQIFRFKSHGLDYKMGQALIKLPKAVTVILDRNRPQTPETGGVPDSTKIESDHCLINRNTNLAKFTMDPNRPIKTQFVHITQPTLFARSRRADLNYGSFNQVLQYLTAYEDVLIKETGRKKEESLRYATGGRADFDTRKDIIVLTEFPQAYQDEDTVTGDIILMHRDTDVIEVEHSNAFSQGNQE